MNEILYRECGKFESNTCETSAYLFSFEDSARVSSDITISVLPAGTCGLRLMQRCDAPINCTGSHKGVNTARLISESDRIPRLQQPLRRRISGDETKVRRRAALLITDQERRKQ